MKIQEVLLANTDTIKLVSEVASSANTAQIAYHERIGFCYQALVKVVGLFRRVGVSLFLDRLMPFVMVLLLP